MADENLKELKLLSIFENYVAGARTMKQLLRATKPFSAFRAERMKQLMVIKAATKRRTAPKPGTRRQSNAVHQLHPRLRLRDGWFLAGWFAG
jgi:hypothetical protein